MLKIRELCVTLHGILEKRLIWMKKTKTTYLLIAVLLGSLAACNKMDDTTIALYDDAVITNFTLGTMNRYIDGVKTTYKGGEYLFHIDQNTRTIYNNDSLLLGTDAAHVVCGLSSLNNGAIWLVSPDKTEMTYHLATDSIDFTTPRLFRVYNSNGTGYNEYTVKVNVHQEDPDLFVWKKMTSIPVMSDLRTVAYGDYIYVFGNEGGVTKAYKSEDGTAWTAVTLPALTDANAWQNAIANEDSLYIMDGTKVYRTKDLATWDEDKSEIWGANKLVRLTAASSQELYGLSDEGMLMVKYCGLLDLGGWISADFEADINAEDLPTADMTTAVYPMVLSDSTDYVLMAGTKEDGTTRIGNVWRRIVDYSEVGLVSELKKYIEELIVAEEAEEGTEGITVNRPTWIRKWTFMESSKNAPYQIPALKNLQVIYYDNELFAFGGQSYQGDIEALSAFWCSRDNGITWKEDESFSMPPSDEMSEFDQSATSFSVVVGKEKEIWIVCAGTGEVWRGHLNRVAWDN